MTDSYVSLGNSSTTFSGPDATKLFAATVVASSIRFYLKTGMKVNRAYTPANMSAFASNLTGKAYKRGKLGLAQAAADIEVWVSAMKSAMPVVDEREGNR